MHRHLCSADRSEAGAVKQRPGALLARMLNTPGAPGSGGGMCPRSIRIMPPIDAHGLRSGAPHTDSAPAGRPAVARAASRQAPRPGPPPPPKQRSGGRQQAFRRKTLGRYGLRCLVCGSAENVEAAHDLVLDMTEGQQASFEEAESGVPLCRKCRRRLDAVARRAPGAVAGLKESGVRCADFCSAVFAADVAAADRAFVS